MRNAFADEVTRLAQEDERVVLLSGDIGNRLFDRFKEIAPERFINCGVAEANMMGMAAGLALSGMRPIAYTITPFVTTRCLEQIRVDVCYHEAPVTIVGVGSGLGYASLGATHHSCEDLAFLRALPNMTVYAPSDAAEVRGGLRAALAQDGPLYMRIGKKGEPVVHDEVPHMPPGGSIRVREGGDLCILAVGVLVPVALAAAEKLSADGIEAEVVSMYSIKPLDERLLEDVTERFGAVVTYEEHSRIGGAGAAVAEWLADRGCTTPLVRVATDDVFLHEAAHVDSARSALGVDMDQLLSAAREAVDRTVAR